MFINQFGMKLWLKRTLIFSMRKMTLSSFWICPKLQGKDLKCENSNNFQPLCLPRVKLELHNPYNFATFKKESIVISRGKRYTISFDINKMVTSEDIAALSIDRRNCLFPHEEKLRFFTHYSSENCKMEQSMTQAVQNAQCISWWFLPFLSMNQSSPIEICHKNSLSQSHFDESLNKFKETNDFEEENGCLDSCESISYSTWEKSEDIQIHQECSTLWNQFIQENTSFPLLKLNPLLDLMTDSGRSGREYFDSLKLTPCKFWMQRSAIVRIKTSNSRVNVIHQYKRVSFLSQLAAFGKLFLFPHN